MTSTLTHDQAVAVYKKHAADMEAKYTQLVEGLESFLKNVRKSTEAKDRTQEAGELEKLEEALRLESK